MNSDRWAGWISCLLLTACNPQQPPPDRVLIDGAQETLRRDRFDLVRECDKRDDSKLTFQHQAVRARGAYDREGSYWPASVRISGLFSCMLHQYPATYQFTVNVAIEVHQTDAVGGKYRGWLQDIVASQVPKKQ